MLNTLGIVMVPILNKDASLLFREAEQSFPEFKPGTRPFVLGGFAAYANPASFHCPLVKALREIVLGRVIKSRVFQEYLEKIRPTTHWGYRLELLFDRMLHRFPDQKPGAETAHRDVTPAKFLNKADDDLLFGGWLNLTGKDQHFVAKPGSHLGIRNTYEVAQKHQGFCTLDLKSDEYQDYQATKETFTVQPGHLIIFPQHLIHEVLSKKSDHEQFRLFFGWRLTKGTSLLFPTKEQTIDDLGVPIIPSGQIPPMFSSNHQSCFQNKPFNWIGSGGPRGTLHDWWEASLLVPMTRRMESLKSYGLDYPGYEPNEKHLMMTLHKLF
jgi:hypothetical protein